jgi:hypothetical protein
MRIYSVKLTVANGEVLRMLHGMIRAPEQFVLS